LVYAAKAYWTFVLFHFSWNKIKNNKTIIVVKGPLPPSFVFFQKGVGVGLCGYKPLWFRQYIYSIDITSRISKGDKSEKGYVNYILHFNLILNINIVGGSKMLWKNISANKPLINLHYTLSYICTPQYTVKNRKLPSSLSGSTLLNPVIVFVRKVLTYE
jgi:hypothetical protein